MLFGLAICILNSIINEANGLGVLLPTHLTSGVGRDLNQCPPGLSSGVCSADKLETPAGYDACAMECVAAQCCQPQDGQPSCMFRCGSKCFSYTDCLNLPSTPPAGSAFSDIAVDQNNVDSSGYSTSSTTAPSDLTADNTAASPNPTTSSTITNGADPFAPSDGASSSSSDTLSVDYYDGFNLNFLIDQSDAEKLMPYSHFSPLKLGGTHVKAQQDEININARYLRGEWTNKTFSIPSSEGYYISLYAAKIGVEFGGQRHEVGRADIFTYTIDPLGKLSLLIVGAYLQVPEIIQNQNDPELLETYHKTITDFALDSRTGEAAYPHFLTFEFSVDEQGLVMAGGDLENSIVLDVKDNCDKSLAYFTKQFVNANSIAWRSAIDKNVNYFNQDFISAPVQVYTLDDTCKSSLQMDHLLQQIPASAKLESVEYYGSSDAAITWKYDDSTETAGTPFLTLEQKQSVIDLKRDVFSDMALARSEAIGNDKAEALISLKQGSGSVWIIWELSDDAVAEMSDQFNFADIGVEIAPVRVAQGEAAKYMLALNVCTSEIGGDLNGPSVRYEWSTYVQVPGSPIPYYMIVQAGSKTDTLDPVKGNVGATPASISRNNDVVTIVANTLRATFNVGTESLTIDQDWLFANGRCYWTNGKPKVSTVSVETDDDFEWKHLLAGQEPIHAFLYEDANTYLVSPWYNMDKTNPLHDTTKLPTFSAMTEISSALIQTGEQEPLVDITIFGNDATLPRLVVNYEIRADSLDEFTRYLNLPDGCSLASMTFTDQSTTGYILTLAISHEAFTFEYQKGPPKNKVVWTTYIRDDNTGDVFLNKFHVVSDVAGLDVETGYKSQAKVFTVSHSDDNNVEIVVQDGGIDLQITVPAVHNEPTKTLGLSEKWINAHDRVYWKKGVYDKLYFNDQLAEARVSPVDKDQLHITQETPWKKLVVDEPSEIFYFLDDATFISVPWENIEEI